jgi:hypothetical protein
MDEISLTFGDHIAALIVDGQKDTPFAFCTLVMQNPDGPRMEVPYLPHEGSGQFDPVTKWFTSRTTPRNLQLWTHHGTVTLYGTRWDGYSEKSSHAVSMGYLIPAEVVLRH